MNIQEVIAYKELSVAKERVKMLTNIWEGRVTFRWDDDRTGSPVEFLEWHRNHEGAEAHYRYKVNAVLLENTPTIDPKTKKITRHPIKVREV